MKSYRKLISLAAILTGANITQAALVAHYQFEETSGTTLVDSINGYDSTVTGSGGDLNVAGVAGSAYQPGGLGNYALVTNGVTNYGIGGNSARTVSVWFKTSDFGVGTAFDNQFRLFGMGSGAAGSLDLVAEDGTGQNRVGLRYGNGNVYYDSDNTGTAFATSTWYHVAVVYDGTTLDLESVGNASDSTGLIVYVNGVEMDTAAGNLNNGTQALVTTLTDFGIGTSNNTSASGYPGLLDDLQIYNEALSSGLVSFLFSNPGLTTEAIPEPSTMVLSGLALAGLGLRRRRSGK